MVKPAEEIIDDILHYMKSLEFPFTSWYVGIAVNPSVALFTEHNVNVNSHWIYRYAGSVENAEEILEQLMTRYHVRNNGEPVHRNARFIFAYAITSGTKQ